MARNHYSYEKRQQELKKQKKRQEKFQKKLEKKKLKEEEQNSELPQPPEAELSPDTSKDFTAE